MTAAEATAVTDRVVLGAEPARSLATVERLRDDIAVGTLTAWRGGVVAPVGLDQVCHLPPPDDDPAWRQRFRPGLCYYRHGPGFLQIRDLRVETAAANFILDDEVVIATFLRCLRPTALAELTAAERSVADDLLAETLLLRLGDHVITLPHRMRRWPVPAVDV